ncbi:MAG TPA: hypothetical protein VGG89_14075 [Candidatus Baltobacteraceae bacterium]|jgi:hypothetical protein
MIENYIAAIFPTLEEAAAANAILLDLSRQGVIRLERSELVGRSVDGELVSEGSDTDASMLIDVAALPGGGDEEARDELTEVMPAGMHALLARVVESDPVPINDAVSANGGIVYRRSIDEIEASGLRRFEDASEID